MKKNVFKSLFPLLALSFFAKINAQSLTISGTGQTGTSGTNWSISASTLTVTGTANIQASVITNAMAIGSLTILGNTNALDVTVDQGITATTSGSGITIGNTNSTGIITFNRTIDIHGALTVYGNQIRMGNTVLSPGLSAELITRVSNGHISLLAKNGFETIEVTSCVRGKIMTAGGGNIHISSDADNNNTGTLNIDWLTIDGSTGAVLMEGDHFSWTTSSGCTMPEFYGTGNFTFRTTNNSSFIFNTQWIALFQSKASITFGRVNNTGTIVINPCTTCNGTPMNAVSQSLTATNGNITLNGGDIIVNHNLINTSTGGSILLKASKEIDITAGASSTAYRTLQTNNGNIVLWSNSLGGTDGGIRIGNWTTLNSANGATNQASGGGKVWLAGGTAVDAAGLPTGPAIGTDNTWSGISLGEYSTGATTTSIYSGGGDIFMNGETNCAATLGHGLGVSWNRTGICRAGNGTISIKGEAKNASGSHGIEIGAYGGNVEMRSSGGSPTVPAIKLEGKTARNDFSGIQTSGNSMQASGTGGINVSAIGNNGGTSPSCILGMSLLSASGDIFVSAQGGTGLRYGGTIGKLAGSTVLTSSSNITLQSNQIAVNGAISVDATGVLVLEPHTTSFTNALTWPITNFTVANGLTGLRLAKDGNAANMTISSAQSIAGPISVYGGTITVNANLTSTATSGTGISLDGQRIIQNVGIAVTTSGANIDYLASGFSTTSGVDNAIKIGGTSGGARASVNAGGGNISLTGSFGTTSAAGETDYGIWLFSTDVITSGTGQITMTGDVTNTLTTASAYGISMGNNTVKTASGAITLNGTGGKASTNSRGIVADGFSNKIISLSGAITINENKPTGLTGTYNGLYMFPTTTVNTFIGADGTEVSSSSSSVTINGDRATFPGNGSFRSNINTSGAIIFESVANTFELAPTLTGLTISGNPSSVRIGKTTNTANITWVNTITAAGPIAIYGGNVFAQQNLTSTLSGAAILLQAREYIDVSASRTVQTNNGNITLRSNSAGTAVVLPNSTTGAITLNSGSSLLSTGGNITLGGNFAGTQGAGLYAASARVGGSPGILISNATLNAAGGNINIYGRCSTSYDDGIRLQANISTTGAGTIGLYGDAFGGYNGTQFFGGITFLNEISRIETENGNLTLEGILTNSQSEDGYALSFYRQTGSSGQTKHIQILSQTGDIQITADRGNTIGKGIGHSSWGHIYFGSPSNNTYSATGDIKFTYSNLVNAGLNGFKVKTNGAVTYEPVATSFIANQIFPPNEHYTVAESASSLTIGKPGNTANITCNATQTVSGPIAIYGGTISINENLNTSAGAALGNILLKGSVDVTLAATKSITTSGAPVILWANSDNETTDGSVALRNGSSIVTGSGSVAGGHIWIGGGSDGTTWNGLSVGSGYTVPGTTFTPSSGGNAFQPSGIYLERNSISSFGGNIKIAGDGAATGRGIVTYGNTVAIDAGSGRIDIDGQVTSTSIGNRGGILFGLHDNAIISIVTLSSSATSGDAITINGVGRGTDDAIGLSGTLNIIASGGGNIVMNGNAFGTGRSIVAGNFYNGILNVFANSGTIRLNGNTKAVLVATPANLTGITAGPSKINIGQGGTITSSSSDVFITGDNINLAAGGIAINTSGEVTVEPSSATFASAVTFPITNLSISNTITGLTIGKPTNSANVTIASPTTIAGPISIYGGTVALNQNIESSNGSTITLFANTLTIPSDKTVKSTNGQLIVAPQITASTIGLAGANGTLQLPATYFSTNFVDGFSEIQIGTSNHSGAIATNAFTLRDNMSFLTSGELTLGGITVLGDNNLTLGAGITNITSGTSNYFQTNGTGKVIRTIPTGSNLLFPIGNAAYNPLSIKNNTGTSDVFSANVIDAVYLNGTSGTTVSTPVVNRTWDISKTTNTNTSPGVDFEFGWNAGEVSNGTLVAPKMNHYTGSVWEVPTVTSTTFTTNNLTVEGYTGSFSPFAISEGTSALPVELTAFNANCTENATTINWQTASEHQSAYFEVEKSRDGANWSLLETVAAAGNSTLVINYSVTDTEKATDVVYYRLNQVDQDGVSIIYGPISANCGEAVDFSVAAFPNPTSGELAIEINNAIAQQVHIQICGTDGKALVEVTYTLEAGTTQLPFNLETFNEGLYTVKVQGEGATETIKVIVR